MIEVFKTNVRDPEQANLLLNQFHETFPGHNANFDLEDCDKIFRVESTVNMDSKIISFIQQHGFNCEELQD